ATTLELVSAPRLDPFEPTPAVLSHTGWGRIRFHRVPNLVSQNRGSLSTRWVRLLRHESPEPSIDATGSVLVAGWAVGVTAKARLGDASSRRREPALSRGRVRLRQNQMWPTCGADPLKARPFSHHPRTLQTRVWNARPATAIRLEYGGPRSSE